MPIYHGDAISHAPAFCYDVTERRLETEALRQARDLLVHERVRMDAMLVHIEDGVALLDAERVPLLVNVAILPADLAGAKVFCDRTRAKIEQLLCPAVERVTISAGIAQLAPDEDPGEAIARADQYLYEAKRAGRNRVIACPQAMS